MRKSDVELLEHWTEINPFKVRIYRDQIIEEYARELEAALAAAIRTLKDKL